MFTFLNKFKKPINNLDDLRQSLDNINNINYGGCGVSAYAMYCYLEKNNLLKEDTQIIYLHDWCENSIKHNLEFIKGNNNNPTSANHVILYHDGYYVDSEHKYIFLNSFRYSSNYFKVPQDITHVFMKLSLNESSWNPRFDRKNIKEIEKFIELNLGINY